ncbi:conserved hypothetical protein [Chlorobaculum parvum NCIB 8327]|uniref:XRE family transcriptional regulator n=1 Tax=Chlorobaculum parvum (strain DSM 263 / NCIMB 8327) TaxID=517417 RepID=B3QRK0_CHLP8|nr:helix-turn-helix transcriptional regulator [Chlorobaculum parvum]ACF10526.1 conserved hypothetical protein [Chlorobaculum parvum NCIB 8327]
MDSIGERMRLFIDNNYRSLADFAKTAEMDVGNLQKYLTNKRTPGTKVLQRFERLGCSASWLLTGEGDMVVEEEAASYQNARKQALEQPSKAVLHDESIKWPPENLMKVLGRAMCPPGEAILEGDDIIIDKDDQPRPGDLIVHSREGYPKIERYSKGDPHPYAICLRLMRNLRPPRK